MSSRTTRLLSAFIIFASLSPAMALGRGKVKFKDHPTNLTVKAGKAMDIDMKTFLADQGSGDLRWQGSNGVPGWLTINSATQHMTGNPGAAEIGSSKFRLTVNDNKCPPGQECADLTEFNLTVVAIPEFKQDEIDLGIQNEDKEFSTNLNQYVENPFSIPLTFSATNLPSWLTLDASGKLSGTPRRPDAGKKYSGIVFTVSGGGGSDTMGGHGEVVYTLHEPSWKAKPITLEDAFEDKAFSRDVNEFVNNPEGTPLQFKMVSGPQWLSSSNEGRLSGTPAHKDIGDVSALVSFTTTVSLPGLAPVTFTKTTEFVFKVQATNHAPVWVVDPVRLPDAFTGKSYRQSLCSSVKDPDGDPLSFEVLSGPNWIKLDQICEIVGTPDKSHIGENAWVVRASDGKLTAQATVLVKVIKSNEPPRWIQKPVILPNAHEDANFTEFLTKYVEDPDKDPVVFQMLSGPAWATVSPEGVLSGKPVAKDLGTAVFSVRVTDNISGADVGELRIFVEHTNHPPEWLLSPIILKVDEEKNLTSAIAQYARDIDGDKLVFTLTGGPLWGKLSADGTFSGTPLMEHEGDNVFNVKVADEGGLEATNKVIVQVLHVNHPPKWTQNPIVLPAVPEGTAVAENLTKFVVDPDAGDTHTYTKVSGPSWATISSDGQLSGTPKRPNLGLQVITVRVMDQANAFAVTEVHINVDRVNKPPYWRQSPIQLADAYEDTDYQFDLSIFAIDDDGDKLTFKKVEGPGWLIVGADGKIVGLPTKTDVGTFTAKFEVSDGKAAATVDANGQVIHRNHPPVVKVGITFEVKERDTLSVSLNDKKYMEDLDGDKLNCGILGGGTPAFVTLSSDCTLTAKPVHKDIGPHSISIRVFDGELFAVGDIAINVVRDPRPPVWVQPIAFEARTNEPFSQDLKPYAKDLDGYALTFEKKDGPAWIKVSPDGVISGTATDPDLGENKLTVIAKNDVLGSDGLVTITVKLGTQVDKVVVDEARPGAPAETLWIVDNSCESKNLTKPLRSSIGVFRSALGAAQIHDVGAYLGTDPKKADGAPVFINNLLLKWDQSDWVPDFQARTDKAFNETCSSSPFWNSFRFYEQVNKYLGDLYKKDYFVSGRPMDVMIVTNQADHYPYHIKGTPQAAWKAADFIASFKATHVKEQMGYRVSAIAPECPKLGSSMPTEASDHQNVFKMLVSATKGVYYPPSCNFSMSDVLKDYAKRVVQRAYIFAKGKIDLSKKPMANNLVKVSLGSLELPGNTGSASDLWRYDASSNAVYIYWEKIDLSTIKPGDVIAIEYRVS